MSTDTILDQPPVVSGHWKTVLIIFLIFGFGCFSGALSTSLIERHRAGDSLLKGKSPVGGLLERRLLRDINLEPDARQKAHEIFNDNSRTREQFLVQLHPQIRALDQQTVAKIDALLQPDQRDQFHHNIALIDQSYGHTLFDPRPAATNAP